ncbi:MAG: hypothetical protein AB7T49_01250 [Oligoflexales bacterium]
MRQKLGLVILFVLFSNSCKSTGGGSGTKAAADRDPFVADFQQRFCAGTVPDMEYLTSKQWTCTIREAYDDNNSTKTGNMEFTKDPVYNNVLTATSEGSSLLFRVSDTLVESVSSRSVNGIPKTTSIVVSKGKDGLLYQAEQIAMKNVKGMTLTAVCQHWGDAHVRQTGFLSLTRCH